MNDETPSSYTIRDLETLRTVSDPLRTQIFELCAEHPSTVREIAERLGLAPTRLYYHINLLEKHGLIAIDETRMVGNLVEKRYRAVAPKLEIDNSLFSIETRQGKENFSSLVHSVLDLTRDELLRTLEARSGSRKPDAEREEQEIVLFHLATHLDPVRGAEFSQRLKSLVSEFEGTDTTGQQTYGLTVAYYPVFYYPNDAAGQPAGEAEPKS